MGYLKILTDISENVTLVQWIDYLVNANHAIIFIGYWIFESNYERVLVLNRGSFDTIPPPPVGDEEAATFETLFCAVRYVCSTEPLKKEYLI